MFRVAIVTFAGERLGYGTGHVMECLRLVDEWRHRDAGIEFRVFLNAFGPALDRVRAAGLPVEIYTDDTYGSAPLATVPTRIAAYDPRLTIVDLPTILDTEIDRLVPQIRPLAVLLDNDQNQFFPVDVLVNYNINQDADFYAGSAGTVCCIGPDYAPLSRTRLDAARAKAAGSRQRDVIVVSFGGTNPNRLALRTLVALRALRPHQPLAVVLGGGTPVAARDEIKDWAATNAPVDVYVDLPQDRFHEILAGSAFVVTAPGNTLYEVCYLGIPAAALAENAATWRVAEAFARRSWCQSLGCGPLMSDAELRVALQRALNAAVPVATFDGLGLQRIVDALQAVLVPFAGADR